MWESFRSIDINEACRSEGSEGVIFAADFLPILDLWETIRQFFLPPTPTVVFENSQIFKPKALLITQTRKIDLFEVGV